ncbi:DUF4349 domain-containing protein [Paenibacillus terrigena]|uniref:DUF4349 domain-containing protein n=1 Tax=Paenibacillus terrigena TaxID=369333 RepID=UPI0012EC6071|nr:DUF4349 domain-containing protein [Paenibacillus terrigena]
MRKRLIKRLSMVLLLCMVFISVATACSSASKSEDLKSTSHQSESAAADQSTAVATEEAKADTDGAGSSKSAIGAGGEGPLSGSTDQRKLIYQANVTMEVKNYGKAQTELQNKIQLVGGYLLQFSDQKSDYELGGNFTFKVPANGFMDFMQQLGKMEHTKYERQLQGQDVTEEYVDLASRLKAKQVVEKRLLGFMDKAVNAGDLLKFSSQLAEVQEQIEQIQGRMRYLDQNVAYSTISLRLYQPIESTDPGLLAKDKTFTERMGITLEKSWDAVVTFFQGLILVLIAIFPFIIILLILAIPLLYYYRKQKRKKIDL